SAIDRESRVSPSRKRRGAVNERDRRANSVAVVPPCTTAQVPDPSNVPPSSPSYQSPVGQPRTVTVPPAGRLPDAFRVSTVPSASPSPPEGPASCPEVAPTACRPRQPSTPSAADEQPGRQVSRASTAAAAGTRRRDTGSPLLRRKRFASDDLLPGPPGFTPRPGIAPCYHQALVPRSTNIREPVPYPASNSCVTGRSSGGVRSGVPRRAASPTVRTRPPACTSNRGTLAHIPARSRARRRRGHRPRTPQPDRRRG